MFNFSTASVECLDKEDILESTIKAEEAYMTLVDSCVNMEQIDGVLENIHTALELINEDNLQELNTDHALENLLGSKELNVVNATEGLGDALKKAWDTLVKWISGVWDSIVNFFKAIFGVSKETIEKADAVKEAAENADESTIKEAQVAADIPKPEQVKEAVETGKEAANIMAECNTDMANLERKIQEVAEKAKNADKARTEDLDAMVDVIAEQFGNQLKRLDELEKKNEELKKDLSEAKTDAENAKKESLATKGWAKNEIAKAAQEVKAFHEKELVEARKAAEQASERRKKILKYAGTTALFLVCPAAGAAKVAYDVGKSVAEKHKAANQEKQSGESTPSPVKEDTPKVDNGLSKKIKGLFSSVTKIGGKAAKLLSFSRKEQTKTMTDLEKALAAKKTADDNASKAIDADIKRRQEEAGLETEGFHTDLQPWMADASQEGFWRKLTYNFTRDFKCAEKIDELIRTLSTMSREDAAVLEGKHVDFRMQPSDKIDKLVKYVDATISWAKTKCEDLKRNGDKWFVGKKVKTELREWAKKQAKDFSKTWKASTMDDLADDYTESGVKLSKGKTYKELGYSKDRVLALAKQFKTAGSGYLHEIKDIRKLLIKIGTDTHIGTMVMSDGSVGVTVEFEICAAVQPILDLLDSAISCYKMVDYFLYYTTKEV